MFNVSRFVILLIIGLVFSANAEARTPSESTREKVRELGFEIGAETSVIPGRLINERTWVDKRHIIVPGTNDRSYLVQFYQTCQGSQSKNMVPRSNKKDGQISKYDRYAPLYEGRNVSICQIWAIFELEPK